MPDLPKVVLCAGTRTPVGHIARSLASVPADTLLETAVRSTIERAKLPKDAVDGLIAGWVGQNFSAPNVARVVLLRSGLPEKAQAMTVQNNCVSSIESAVEAARRIATGEGELYIACGTESMSRMSYSIEGSRAAKELRSLQTIKEKWANLFESGQATLVDSLEMGLTDPVRDINMAGTAEVCAQTFGIPRADQDAYARESFRRAVEGWKNGFYATHVVPLAPLDKDEYPFLREDLIEKPQMFAKAPALFDNSAYSMKDFFRDYGKYVDGKKYEEGATKGTVTLFNSCGRSDGAAAVIVASERRAKALGLEILGTIKGWGFVGNDPAVMGLSPALAAPVALERAGVAFDALDQIELHEPFAATVLSLFKLGKQRFGHDWHSKHASGALNPHGGSIAIGHPLGATGTRLLLNLLHALKRNPKARYGMIAACAGGGMGGALVVEKAG